MYHEECGYASESVRGREREEHSPDIQEGRKDVDQGHKEKQLAAEGQENRLFDHPETLEKIGRDHLPAHQEHNRVHRPETFVRDFFQLRVVSEYPDHRLWEELRCDEPEDADPGSP